MTVFMDFKKALNQQIQIIDTFQVMIENVIRELEILGTLKEP